MRLTDKYYFFWGELGSQWEPSKFTIDGVQYNCAEQYMMAQKATLFQDWEALTTIMSTNDPAKQKYAGRLVKNFDAAKWNEISRLVVYRANLAKFSQNYDMWEELLALGDVEIVEASPEDKIWGIGLHWMSDDCLDKTKWQGKNWLGEAIMQVRTDLKQLYRTIL